jgi:uncharacterized protein YegP (UPF0339 family)
MISYEKFEPGKEGTYYKTHNDDEEIKKKNGAVFKKYVDTRKQQTIDDPTNVFYSTKFPFIPHFKGYSHGIKYAPALYYIIKKDKNGEYTFELIELKGYYFEIATGELYNSYNKKLGGKGARTKIITLDGKPLDKPINIYLHIMFLVSLYPYFNWRFFFENSRPGGCVSVDHLLGPGSSRRCHPNLLEVVSHIENVTRTGHFNTKRSAESIEKGSVSNSKSVSIKKNGVDVIDDNGDIIEYTNAKECAKVIYKGKENDKELEKKINSLSTNIGEYIRGVRTSIHGYTEYTFTYGQSYIKSQEDLYITKWRLDCVNNKYVIEEYQVKEIWTYYKDLDEERKKEIKKIYNGKDDKIPIAISNCGRVINQRGEKSYGSWLKSSKKRMYNGHAIYTIMWYWFASIEEIKKIQNRIQYGLKLCHCDGKLKHPLVKRQSENGEENSNIWGTFYLGDDDSNGKDNSANQLRKAQENKEGHFKAFKDGKPISDKIFVSRKDFNNWAEKQTWYTEKFIHIPHILKGKKGYNTEHGLTFKKVYDITETFIEV